MTNKLLTSRLMSPIMTVLDKSRTTEGNQQSKLQGIANKMAGFSIKTDPRVTKKGNTTCATCMAAKATGAPLPPEHPNCRCKIVKK